MHSETQSRITAVALVVSVRHTAEQQCLHVKIEMCMCRDVTLLYSWIDPRSEEFAIDITKGKIPTGHVTSTLPPVAPRTVVRR